VTSCYSEVISGRSPVPSEKFESCYKENGGNAAFLITDCPDPSMKGEPTYSEWDARNKALNEGMTKLLLTLKNEKASTKQQRIEAKFSKLKSKDLPKGSDFSLLLSHDSKLPF